MNFLQEKCPESSDHFRVGNDFAKHQQTLCNKAFEIYSKIGRKIFENWAFGRFLDEPSGRAERGV